MLSRTDLRSVVAEALKKLGGQAKVVEVAKYIWEHYETDLRSSGDLFYTWQYDMRWAATQLREQGIIKAPEKTGVWVLA